MKKFIQLSLLAAAALSSAQAFAASPKWDLVELDYVKADIDDTDIEPDGFSIMATKLVTDNVFITGSFSALSDDVFGVDVDLDTLNLGVGYKHSLTESTDWYGTLSYVDVKAEGTLGSNSASVDESGFGIATGVRSMMTEQFELAGEISYVDIDDADETTFAVKGYYYVTEQVALSAGYSVSSDADSFEIGARFAF